MTTYLLYVASPVLVAILQSLVTAKSINESNNSRKTYLIICGIIMALMIGLRNPRVGSGDTQFYVHTYEQFSKISLPQLIRLHIDMEFGYVFTAWLLSHIFPNGQWLLGLSGVFFAVSVCCFANKNCKNLPLALLAFNCLGLFNFMVQGLRQAIAMCICLWALEQLKKRKTVQFFLVVALAVAFHGSAVVFAVVYLISKLRLTFRGVMTFFVLAVLSVSMLPVLFRLFNQIMNDSYEIGATEVTGGVVAILIYVVIIIFGMMFIDTENPHNAIFIYMTILGAVCMIMRNTVSGIVERIADYFAFGQMVILANSTYTIRNPDVKVLVNYLAGALMLGVALYKASYSVLIPYTFFWQ